MRDVGGCCAVIEPGLSGALDRWHLAMPGLILSDGRGDCERHRTLGPQAGLTRVNGSSYVVHTLSVHAARMCIGGSSDDY